MGVELDGGLEEVRGAVGTAGNGSTALAFPVEYLGISSYNC